MTMYGAACRRLSGSAGTRLVKPTLPRHFGMTMYGAAFGRVLRLGAGTVGTRHSSELVKPDAKRIFHVDTLALVGKLKSRGVDPKVAHAMTVTMMEVLNEFTDNASDSFISNSEMQRSEMLMENNVSNFKIEVKSLQDQRRLLVQHKLDIMSTNVERMLADTRNETRNMKMDVENKYANMVHQIDKMKTEWKLESLKLNSEIEKMYFDSRQEYAKELDVVRAEMEAAKYRVSKYFIGTLVFVCVAGFGAIHIFM